MGKNLGGATLLVTGGAGFVGANLACGLRARHPDLTVVALDNLHRRGSELNLPRLRAAGVRFVHGDIRKPEDLDAAGAADFVVECSAEPAVLAGYGGDRRYMIDTNLVGTLNCVEHAVRHGAAMIFLSTSRVYPIEPVNALAWTEAATRYVLAPAAGTVGASAAGLDVDFPLGGHRSLYGATKLCSELLITEYAQAQGLRAVSNRCAVIAGPWQMGKVDQGVTSHWLLAHRFGRPLSYIGYEGSGKQTRDVLHVDDLLDLVELQLAQIDSIRGETFNVGGGLDNTVSLLELTELCREVTGRRVEIGRDPRPRQGDLRFFITDNRHVTQRLGWRPKRGVRQLLADLDAWIGAHSSQIEQTLLA
jgi:CDP-paratose 2-epimerase